MGIDINKNIVTGIVINYNDFNNVFKLSDLNIDIQTHLKTTYSLTLTDESFVGNQTNLALEGTLAIGSTNWNDNKTSIEAMCSNWEDIKDDLEIKLTTTLLWNGGVSLGFTPQGSLQTSNTTDTYCQSLDYNILNTDSFKILENNMLAYSIYKYYAVKSSTTFTDLTGVTYHSNSTSSNYAGVSYSTIVPRYSSTFAYSMDFDNTDLVHLCYITIEGDYVYVLVDTINKTYSNMTLLSVIPTPTPFDHAILAHNDFDRTGGSYIYSVYADSNEITIGIALNQYVELDDGEEREMLYYQLEGYLYNSTGALLNHSCDSPVEYHDTGWFDNARLSIEQRKFQAYKSGKLLYVTLSEGNSYDDGDDDEGYTKVGCQARRITSTSFTSIGNYIDSFRYRDIDDDEEELNMSFGSFYTKNGILSIHGVGGYQDDGDKNRPLYFKFKLGSSLSVNYEIFPDRYDTGDYYVQSLPNHKTGSVWFRLMQRESNSSQNNEYVVYKLYYSPADATPSVKRSYNDSEDDNDTYMSYTTMLGKDTEYCYSYARNYTKTNYAYTIHDETGTLVASYNSPVYIAIPSRSYTVGTEGNAISINATSAYNSKQGYYIQTGTLTDTIPAGKRLTAFSHYNGEPLFNNYYDTFLVINDVEYSSYYCEDEEVVSYRVRTYYNGLTPNTSLQWFKVIR